MEDKITKTSEIRIKVGVNENNLPIAMKWTAQDGNVEEAPASALLLSLWDSKDKNTMKIDLWTKDMSIEEMKQFFHQTLLTMADTFERATGEHLISEDLRDYCYHFADKMNILPE
ncbi:MAG: gliding motility protein GldC [Cryomorphaceae bacterium]|jgi:gliding motility-associated protein GldC|nr:gliding motility protein GldC [Cryomorphaceae bacterium]